MELKKYGIIYKIINNANNKVYIGQTTRKNGFNGRYTSRGVGIERVYGYYKYGGKNGNLPNNHLFRAIEKYGVDNFEVVEEFDTAYSKEELDEKERHWITFYNSCDWRFGYNMQMGGDRGSYTKSAYLQYAINANFINPIMLSTGEVFATLQEAERETGKTRYVLDFKYLKDIPKARKPIVCLNTSEIFISPTHASKNYNIARSDITKCCQGKLKIAGKHPVTGEKMVWIYLSEFKSQQNIIHN